MSLRIHPSTPAPLDDSTSSQNASGAGSTQGHHHHHKQHTVQGRKTANRQRTRRRRGADSQDGIDESGASEELLMMLEEHLQRNAEMVMRVGERRQGSGGGNAGGGQQGDREHDQSEIAAARSRMRLVRDSTGADDIEHARENAESALLEARRAQAAAQPATISTYEVLSAMREFLAMPHTTAHTPGKLAAIRARLIEAVQQPVARAPVRQHSINLLLPLMLLNLERERTAQERALALAKINSLLGHRRARL